MTKLDNAIYIVGISTITSNEEAFKSNTIGKLWDEFAKSPIKEKLDTLSSNNVYAVYSDYENDHTGKYKITIGYAINETKNIPSQYSVMTIPSGKYQQFKPKSLSTEHLVETWQTIWKTNPELLQRNYKADFEEYNDKDVSIYIGVK